MPKASNKKTSLRASLVSHQTKAAAEHRAKAGHKNAYAPSSSKPGKKARTRSLTTAETPIWHDSPTTASTSYINKGKAKATIPFKASDHILLIGEGNFSFSLSLLVSETITVTPSLLYATCYDTESACYAKYPEEQGIVARIKELGSTVIFGVDATCLDKRKELRKHLFDKIVFNFPHVGAGIKDQDRNILVNQELMLGFLQSSATLLSKGIDPTTLANNAKRKKKKLAPEPHDDGPDYLSDVPTEGEEDFSSLSKSSVQIRGSVLITLRDSVPYTLWEVPRLAKNPPISKSAKEPVKRYSLLRSFAFLPELYSGYEHRRTIGGATGLAPNEDLTRMGGACRTWEFVLRDEIGSP